MITWSNPLSWTSCCCAFGRCLRRANIEMERKLVVGNLELDADGLTAPPSTEKKSR